MALIEIDVGGLGAPESGARVRDELRPIGGLLGGILGFGDTSCAPLTLGTGITLSGAALDFGITNTGLTRAVSVTYPLTFVFSGSTRNSARRYLGSIATTADKTVRVYGEDGNVVAQHVATSNAAATAAGVWNYGRVFNCVAVFASQTDVRVYAKGSAGRASGSSATDVGALGTLNKLSFGVYDGSVKLNQQDGITEIAQWLNYAATPAEAWAWVDNPQDIFEPQAVPIYVSAAAPTLPTPTLARAKSGSITSTGWISQITAG